MHSEGLESQNAMDESREKIAKILNCTSDAEKCNRSVPPYSTQGIFPAALTSLAVFFPTLALTEPVIEIDFIFGFNLNFHK